MTNDNTKFDYPYIRAWGQLLGSYEYFIEAQIERAQEDNAPDDAVYVDQEGRWHRFAHVTNEETRQQIDQLLPR